MHNAVLSLDMNRASMVSISIPGLTEPHPYELILHPGVFLCLADKFTYDVVSTGLFHVTALIIDRWYLNFFTEILLTIFSFFPHFPISSDPTPQSNLNDGK